MLHAELAQDVTGYEESTKAEQRAETAREVAIYLWRNYVEWVISNLDIVSNVTNFLKSE